MSKSIVIENPQQLLALCEEDGRITIQGDLEIRCDIEWPEGESLRRLWVVGNLKCKTFLCHATIYCFANLTCEGNLKCHEIICEAKLRCYGDINCYKINCHRSLRCDGTLYCEGSLSCADLTCHDLYCRSLFCRGRIKGRDLRCSSNLECERSIYGRELNCGGNLECKGIVDCVGDLHCGGKLRAYDLHCRDLVSKGDIFCDKDLYCRNLDCSGDVYCQDNSYCLGTLHCGGKLVCFPGLKRSPPSDTQRASSGDGWEPSSSTEKSVRNFRAFRSTYLLILFAVVYSIIGVVINMLYEA